MLRGGASDVPDIFVDEWLCRTYGWTWAELQATPVYVRNMYFAQNMWRIELENAESG